MCLLGALSGTWGRWGKAMGNVLVCHFALFQLLLTLTLEALSSKQTFFFLEKKFFLKSIFLAMRFFFFFPKFGVFFKL
jgi:hypothetical protein